MKKIISLALSVALALSLAACGGSNTSTAASSTANSEPSTEAIQTEAPESEPEETPEAKSEFQEKTIVDNEYCTVILKDIDEDGLWGYSWKIYLENKTADKTLMFSMNNTSVNGVMVDPLWAATVAPGKKSNETISWMSTSLEENNIKADDITQVSFTLDVYDNDDWTADKFVDEEFTVYPKGEENATTVEREAQSTDIVLFDNDSCSMTVAGFEHDDIFGYTVKVYLVNKTDKDLMFSCNDASINGYMADPFWATTVAAGKTSNSDISWSDSTLEENGIDISSIEEIELPITVYPNDDWTADKLVDETFTINPQ